METENKYFEVRDWPEGDQHLAICPDPSCGGDTRLADYRRTHSLDPSQARAWWMKLQCAECLTFYEGRFDEPVVKAYEDTLQAQETEIAKELHDMVSRNMYDETEVFVAALRRDIILPEDF